MLLSNAVRLAQANGMHLQQWESNIPLEEIMLRNSLWWLLYAYDKHLASRSGRPNVRQILHSI
jgi:hypothetical protein